MHWSGPNSDLKHFLRHIFKGGEAGGGLIFKNRTNKQIKTLKNDQKYAIKFDRMCKNAKHTCINKRTFS